MSSFAQMFMSKRQSNTRSTTGTPVIPTPAEQALIDARARRQQDTQRPLDIGTGFLNLVRTAYVLDEHGKPKVKDGSFQVAAYMFQGSLRIPGGETVQLECTQLPTDTHKDITVRRFKTWEKLGELKLPNFVHPETGEIMPYVEGDLTLPVTFRGETRERKMLVRVRRIPGAKYLLLKLPQVIKPHEEGAFR